jgi:hypothetical protein
MRNIIFISTTLTILFFLITTNIDSTEAEQLPKTEAWGTAEEIVEAPVFQQVSNTTKTSAAAATEFAYIPDDNLKKQINNWLYGSYESLEEVSIEAMRNETKKFKFVMNYQVTDLTGLENAINITELEMNGFTNLGSLTPLKGLTKLTYLNINAVQLTDFEALSNLVNLKHLDLAATGIQDQDVSVLSGLTNLTFLALQGNEENLDVSSLSGLTNLKHFYHD